MTLVQRLALVSSFAALTSLLGCAEDLGPVTQAFTTSVTGWNSQIDEAKKAGAALEEKIAAVTPPAAEDTAGKELKTKAEAALGDHKAALGELEKLVADAKAAFDKASVEQKIAPCQAVIDDTKTKFDAGIKKVGELAAAAGPAYDALKKHADEEGAKAAAAAAAAAAAEAAERKLIAEGGEMNFPIAFTDGAVDVAAAESLAALDHLEKFLKSGCPALKVDLTTNAADAKAAKAFGPALKTVLVTKGIAATVFGKIAGGTGTGVVVKVTKPCK